ncbi:hypothetical protein KUTeg_020832 [Tegillarca granosa]|uniref:Uncharacterized protein n=1 Tax=Tegillarca granosa TaxID=220873 RepID=A0ABQ9EEI1_TEGGR|nr:hypothetical protein KUTeg_020832 [Tegillarca granosa]
MIHLQLEEDYTSCAAAVEQRALAVTEKDILDSPPLCPICMKNELKLDETGLRLGQNHVSIR